MYAWKTFILYIKVKSVQYPTLSKKDSTWKKEHSDMCLFITRITVICPIVIYLVVNIFQFHMYQTLFSVNMRNMGLC